MPHIIRFYEKAGDSLIVEHRLKDVPLTALQKIFGLPSNDQMYLCYDINDRQASCFQKITKIDFKLEQFDYFLEYDS